MKFYALIFSLILAGCVQESKTPEYTVRVPLIEGCEAPAEKARSFFDRTINQKDLGQIDVNVHYFDKGQFYTYPVKGLIEISSSGVDVIGALNIRDYLNLHVTSIQASCSPRQKMVYDEKGGDSFPSFLKRIESQSKTPVSISYSDKEISIFYNNDTYEYQQ